MIGISWRMVLLVLLQVVCLLHTMQATFAEEPVKKRAFQGYLYVEPYQVRFEALLDVALFASEAKPEWVLPEKLSVDDQKKLIQQAAAQCAAWVRLAVDEAALSDAEFTGANIVKGAPGNTLPLEPNEDVNTSEAMIGLSWEIPSPPIANDVTVEWKGFIQGQTRLPVRVFFGPRSEVVELTTDKPVIQWRSEGRVRAPSPLATVPEAVAAPLNFRLGSVIWILGCVVGYVVGSVRMKKQMPGGVKVWVAAALLGGAALWPVSVPLSVKMLARIPAVTDVEQAETIVSPLLRNVYRAFDQRSESQIYDVLARSVDGDLLRQLYLDTIQALTLDGREGTRVTIRDFDATVKSVNWQSSASRLVVDCEWTALGTVGHWGHTHTRVNRYVAKVTIAPIEREWKIVQLEVTEARPL